MNLRDALYRPSLNYIKKERFTGSNTGMRFMFEKKKNGEDEVILACVWPEPFSFENTVEDKKEYMEFVLTDEGLQEAIKWVESKQPALNN